MPHSVQDATISVVLRWSCHGIPRAHKAASRCQRLISISFDFVLSPRWTSLSTSWCFLIPTVDIHETPHGAKHYHKSGEIVSRLARC